MTKRRDIEAIADLLVSRMPGVTIQQLKVTHPGADDDGLWFVNHPSARYEAQLESPTGQCPFLVESDGTPDAETAGTVDEAVAAVQRRLDLQTS